MNLKNLLVPIDNRKPKNVVYDKDWGVSFDIIFLSKSEMQKLMSKNTKLVFNPRTHTKEEEIDGEGMRAEIVRNCVKGWKGVTYKWLSSIIVFDTTQVKLEDEVEFNEDNRDILFKEAYGLDSWLLDTVRNAANFNEKKDAEIKN